MKKYNEIDDNEIRIISSNINNNEPSPENRKRKAKRWGLLLFIGIAVIGGLLYLYNTSVEQSEQAFTVEKSNGITARGSQGTKKKGFVAMTDTTINGNPLTLLTPHYATARLQIGVGTLHDKEAVLVVQAADVRKDNGEIVGTYVSEGNLISKGQAKSGFCAILNGTPIIGVSDATPYLEQAIEMDGYFFRQYPLVAGGYVVENKPKGKSFRRALAERNGSVFVVISQCSLTFHDFAQALADMGVVNAIYLVGSLTRGFAIDSGGNRIEFGNMPESEAPSKANYIVWK